MQNLTGQPNVAVALLRFKKWVKTVESNQLIALCKVVRTFLDNIETK